MNVSWIRWVTLVLVAAGCGGRVDEGHEGAGSSDPPAAPDEGEGEPGDEPDEPADGGVSLPGCEKGFDASAEPDRPCNWLAKGSCYEDKLAACACVCPRDTSATSHCASGFPVEDGRVEVYCY
jgi:hypothetical protein